MDLLILAFIGWCFVTIVFIIGRYACPRHDRVPLIEVDRVIAWTTLRRGWHALSSFGPAGNSYDDITGRNSA